MYLNRKKKITILTIIFLIFTTFGYSKISNAQDTLDPKDYFDYQYILSSQQNYFNTSYNPNFIPNALSRYIDLDAKFIYREAVQEPFFEYYYPMALPIYNDGILNDLNVLKVKNNKTISNKYFLVYPLMGGMSKFVVSNVGQKSSYGYLNKNAQVAIPAKYDQAFPFSDGLALVVKNKNISYIDKNGKTVINLGQKYQGASSFSDGLAKVIQGMYGMENCKVSYINKSGKIVFTLPPKSYSEDFSQGILNVSNNGNAIFYNTSGKKLFEFKNAISTRFREGYGIIMQPNKMSLINKNGKVISSTNKTYMNAYPVSNGRIIVKDHNNKYGVLNLNLKEIVPPKYSFILPYRNTKAIFGIDAQYTEFVKGLGHQNIQGPKCGIIDLNGNIILQPKYKVISPFNQGKAVAYENGKHFYLNSYGRKVDL